MGEEVRERATGACTCHWSVERKLMRIPFNTGVTNEPRVGDDLHIKGILGQWVYCYQKMQDIRGIHPPAYRPIRSSPILNALLENLRNQGQPSYLWGEACCLPRVPKPPAKAAKPPS